MTALIDRYTLRVISRNIGEVVVAYIAALIANGGDLAGGAGIVAVAQILLAIKLNVFAVPLAWTPVFAGVEPWVWYVIVVMWLFRIVQLSGYTTGEIAAQIERAYYALSVTPTPTAGVHDDARADGGTERETPTNDSDHESDQ